MSLNYLKKNKLIRFMDIIKYNQFNLDYFTYKKKISLNQKYSEIPIYYNNNHLIIQTPVLFVPFEISYYNTLDISFTNTDDNRDIKQFQDTIKLIINKASKKYKRKFVNPLIEDDYYPCRLRCDVSKNVLIFDENKNLTNVKTFQAKTYCKFLLHISKLWAHKSKYGLSISILQAKLHKSRDIVLEDYSFIDSDNEYEPEHEDLSKYKNMLKAGVPKHAIIQKMNIDNINPSLMFHDAVLPPPPPPPPLPNIRNALLSSINSGNFKLKKVKKKTPTNNNSNGFKISSNDLLNALSKLKKNSSTV